MVAQSPDPDARRATPAQLDELVLGGPRRYTRSDLADRAGISLDEARRLWHAMGFADLGDDEVAFTDADLEAVELAKWLQDEANIDPATRLSMARAMGLAMAQLAEAQVATVGRLLLDAEPDPDKAVELAVPVTEALFDPIQRLVLYVWRRQTAAAMSRAFATFGTDVSTRELAVGFADLVGYTELSRSLHPEQLGEMVERFESTISERIAQRGGRVVKTVGDEVMYVADDLAAAAEIGLETAERHAADEELPDVRVGVAYGSVLNRLGDFFGPVVNIAARLTSIARPNTVLVDRVAAEQLEGNDAYYVKPIPQQSVRGYRHLAPYVVRRREPDD